MDRGHSAVADTEVIHDRFDTGARQLVVQEEIEIMVEYQLDFYRLTDGVR